MSAEAAPDLSKLLGADSRGELMAKCVNFQIFSILLFIEQGYPKICRASIFLPTSFRSLIECVREWGRRRNGKKGEREREKENIFFNEQARKASVYLLHTHTHPTPTSAFSQNKFFHAAFSLYQGQQSTLGLPHTQPPFPLYQSTQSLRN